MANGVWSGGGMNENGADELMLVAVFGSPYAMKMDP